MARRELGPAGLEVAQAVTAALRTARPAGPVVVACSGGADSLALALGAVWAAPRLDLAVSAVVVDHGLQAGSAAVAEAVARQLAGLGLAARIWPVTVSDAAGGLEDAARRARYEALERASAPEGTVLLGHTLDDQAETVLLGLARGSGARSVAGMAAQRGRFLRPLLGVRAATTRRACAEAELEPWQDPQNADPRFARSRVRHRVLPLLEAELGPGIAEALARTAALERADADLLDALAAAEPAASQQRPDCADLAGMPPALLGRVLHRWLRAAGARDLSAAHLAAVVDLVEHWHGQRWVDLPGLRVRRRDHHLEVVPACDGPAVSAG